MFESWDFRQIQSVSYFCSQKELGTRVNARVEERQRSHLWLRIQRRDGSFGYSCLSPLEKMGDLGELQLLQILRECLKQSALGLSTSEILSSYYSQYPQAGGFEVLVKSLDFNFSFESLLNQFFQSQNELQKIENNFFIGDFRQISELQLQEIIQQGFSRVKIKLGREDLSDFYNWAKGMRHCELALRLDFNAALTSAEYLSFVNWACEFFFSSIQPLRLEYVEDPCAFSILQGISFEQDEILQVPVFLDREINFAEAYRWLHPSVKGLVLKPSQQRLDQALRLAEILKLDLRFTHYVDTDLSRVFSLSELLTKDAAFKKKHLFGEAQGFLMGALAHDEVSLVFEQGPNLQFNEAGLGSFKRFCDQARWLSL